MSSVVQYRLSMKKNIGRKSRKSVVASAAYIARERLKDRESGKIYDYRTGHSEVLFSKILTPDIVPEWAHNREELWNKVQETEFRKDAQYARSLEISLPYEFSLAHMVELIENFVHDNFTSKGMIADVALHKPDKHSASDRNYHAHILLTLRSIDKDCFGYKVREWNHLNQLRSWREDLAFKLSKMFERPPYINVDRWLPHRWLYSHLTLVQQRKKALERGDYWYAQACDHEPTKHKGVEIYHIEKRGVASYVEKIRHSKRARSKTIQHTKSPDIEQPMYKDYDVRQAEKFNKRTDHFVESVEQQRKEREEQRAIDDEIVQKFSHLSPELKDGISPEKRAQLVKALEYSKQAERDIEKYEQERERKQERERER